MWVLECVARVSEPIIFSVFVFVFIYVYLSLVFHLKRLFVGSSGGLEVCL